MVLPKITLAAIVSMLAASSAAAVIGTSVAAQSITLERIAQLPKSQQAAWKEYFYQSAKQRAADQAVLFAECKAAGLIEPLIPPNGSSAKTVPLTRPAEWYGTAEAWQIADAIVSFQTPAGGWSKNLDMVDHSRRKGESFAPNNLSHYLGPA